MSSKKKNPGVTEVYSDYCRLRNYAALHFEDIDLEADVLAYTATVHGNVPALKKIVAARAKHLGLKASDIQFTPAEGAKDTWSEQTGTYANANARFHELRQIVLDKEKKKNPLPTS